jgi:hypothetical protein
VQYRLINSVLFRVNYDGVILRWLERIDGEKVLKDLHDGLAGGNFVGDTTIHKILRVGYSWPTLFKDAHAYARNCKICQLSAGREKRAAVPLQPVTVSRPFEKWGLYHRRYFTKLFETTQVHSYCNQLFHKMGRSHSSNSRKQEGSDPIHRRTINHKIRCPFCSCFWQCSLLLFHLIS